MPSNGLTFLTPAAKSGAARGIPILIYSLLGSSFTALSIMILAPRLLPTLPASIYTRLRFTTSPYHLTMLPTTLLYSFKAIITACRHPWHDSTPTKGHQRRQPTLPA